MLKQSLWSAWHAYERQLAARPAATKATVASVMFAITDVAVQYMERESPHDRRRDSSPPRRDDDDLGAAKAEATSSAKRGAGEAAERDWWSARRTATQAGFGVYYGVVHAHLMWGALELAFKAGQARYGVALPALGGALARVAVDQFVTGTPVFNSVFFYSTGRFAQGMSHEDAVANVRARLVPMLQLHWAFWVPFHTLNFWLVPFRHRVLPAQVALFGWSAFLSHTGARRSGAIHRDDKK